MNDWEGTLINNLQIRVIYIYLERTYTLERSYSITTNVHASVCMSVYPYFCMSGLGGNVIFSASN